MTQGGKVFTALAEELRAKLKTYPAALDEKKDAKKIEERDRYRQDFLQAQLLAARPARKWPTRWPKTARNGRRR